MSNVLCVQHLCKEYPKFKLQDVSFSVEAGSIMGFIGRNGAGKTTTLKSLMNLVHPSSGDISFFGLSLKEHENEIKQRIGYATGGVHYYQRKRIKDVIAITKPFYENWDDEAYHHYLDLFALDEEKKLMELSEGMKVKFNLTMALSHHADFLILDEPTSGLDPVSREELLEVFLDIAAKGVAILFSTHITSDLDKCADSITYIQKGRILASKKADDFVDGYRLIKGCEGASAEQKEKFLGVCRSKDGDTALIHAEDAALFAAAQPVVPDLETIMVHLEKESV
jgi:ABC-2 type transport system ATP-binding protein